MRKKPSGISRILAKMTILPLFVFGVVTTVFSLFWVTSSMEVEVKHELANLSNVASTTFDMIFPGDYAKYSASEGILVTKGNIILNDNYDFLDTLKEQTNVDYTIFYGDMRIITTLHSTEGTRLSGTTASSTIVADVIGKGSPVFYANVEIFGSKYFSYYAPLYNSDGSCVGMIATLMQAKRAHFLVFRAVLPILILSLFAIILAFFWSLRYAKEFIRVIRQMETTFENFSSGAFVNIVPPELLARKDEFGSMSHSFVRMQSSLRVLIEQDALTGLSNRRFGQHKLDQLIEQTKGTRQHFSLAMGDIDHFKHFNDTYGHDCGDLVLCEIAQLLQHHIRENGYCIRWGGEEFLIVLTKGTYEEHVALMQGLIERIREKKIDYQDTTFCVTMTFGLIETYMFESSDEMCKEVDNLLYYGKEHGRNRLVTKEVQEEI